MAVAPFGKGLLLMKNAVAFGAVFALAMLASSGSSASAQVLSRNALFNGLPDRILYNFNQGYGLPNATLARDASGNLYGTTSEGTLGSPNAGEVFKLVPNGRGKYKPVGVHAFGGYPLDGADPSGTLVVDSNRSDLWRDAAGRHGRMGIDIQAHADLPWL